MGETFHPFDVADAVGNQELRAAFASVPKQDFGPAGRDAFDKQVSSMPAPEGVTYGEAELAGIHGYWARPPSAPPDAAMLYLHGGGFTVGSAQAFRHMGGHVAVRAGVAAFVADYSLAPEQPFPAAFDDAVMVFEALRTQFGRVAVVGDSAGGSLALAVAAAVRGSTAPAGIVAFSPHVDFAMTTLPRGESDPVQTAGSVSRAMQQYLHGADATDPRASVMYAPLAGLPPIQIHVGEDEVVLDPVRVFAQRAEAAGSPIDLQVWQCMHHVFVSKLTQLATARHAMARAGAALRGWLVP